LTKSLAREAIRDLFVSEPDLAEETSMLAVDEIDGDKMPEPYRGLLVHATDMTHKLQAFSGQTIHVRPLHVDRDGHKLHRRVLLICDNDGRTIEFGVIRIHLERFSREPREEILDCRVPLGAILKHHNIAHRCEPRFYFRLSGSTFLRDAFELDCATTLYGRLNHIVNEAGEELADVVEVLPPLFAPQNRSV
jgi:chorismate-pyruvate lyase